MYHWGAALSPSPLADPAPNHPVEPTANSVRCAPAVGGGSPGALDVEEMRNLQSHPKRVTLLCVLWCPLTWTRSDVVRQERR